MDVSGELRGLKIKLTSLPFDIWFRDLQCPANEVDMMLRAFYLLDERGADGVVGGCDVYE